MQDVRIKLPKAHSLQQPIIDSKAKVKVLKCGRQSGKSTVCLIECAKKMLEGKTVAYVCHKFDLSKTFYNSLLKVFPKEAILKNNSSSLSIELKNGGIIQFFSGEATDTLRGKNFHLVICDEFAFWRNPQESYDEHIGATLARYNGDVIIASTPFGKNFFYQIWQTSMDDTSGRMEGFYFTCLDNPYLSKEYLEWKRTTVSNQTWMQEYLALETANSNCIVDADVIIRNTIPALSTKPPVVIGIDVAKVMDWTVFCGLDEDGKMCLFQRFQKDWIPTMNLIKALPADVLKVMDKTGAGDVVLEQLQAEVPNLIGFHFTSKSKPPLIQEFILSLERDELKFNDFTATEINNFCYKNTASGYVEYEGKPHDDAVCAIAIANKYRKNVKLTANWSSTFSTVSW